LEAINDQGKPGFVTLLLEELRTSTCLAPKQLKACWRLGRSDLAPDSRAGGGAPEMESRLSTLTTCGFEPHWRPQPAKLPSFSGYSLETLPYLTLVDLLNEGYRAEARGTFYVDSEVGQGSS